MIKYYNIIALVLFAVGSILCAFELPLQAILPLYTAAILVAVMGSDARG